MKGSKISKYKLEEDIINLRQSGLSLQQIANELNASGKIPEGDEIDKYMIWRFLEKTPQITREIVKKDKKRMIEVVNNNLDIVHEVSSLFNKTKNLLEMMEDDAYAKGRLMNPHQFKAISGEMREMLKLMIDIQKEISDYDNVRKFMEIVMETIKETSPDSLPLIIEKLKTTKNTRWFGELFNNGE